ncbi:dTMP kinase [Planctomycetota bacterium]
MSTKLSGKFIVLDGPDGCGKSTQAELLNKWLKEQGIDAVRFRDPGDTAIGEKIREILLNPEHCAMSTETEVLLYMAARAQLWAERMAPALRNNQSIVLDRWLSSTLTYQGWAGGIGMDKIIKIASDCLDRVWPDITIILDVNQQTASERLNRELDRMEAKGQQYHKKVREGFLKLAGEHDNCFVIDASGDIEDIHQNIIQLIMEVSSV